jgi:dTDP-4-dehydrorhamnose reductase
MKESHFMIHHRILLTGYTGQLGFVLAQSLSLFGEVIITKSTDFDLSDPDHLTAYLDRIKPTIIVNPAAYTAVDLAESNAEKAMNINAKSVQVIATWAAKHQALFVHYSTDYVFDGQLDRPYVETDPVNPLSIYGQSKQQGEAYIAAANPKHYILRTSWVFGLTGKNFMNTMIQLLKQKPSLSIVADQVGAPTSTYLLSEVTCLLIQRYIQGDEHFGLYHLTASGAGSWYDFASYIARQLQKHHVPLALDPSTIQAISTAQYPLPAPRPLNSRLDCHKIETYLNIRLPHWQDAVAQTIATRARLGLS